MSRSASRRSTRPRISSSSTSSPRAMSVIGGRHTMGMTPGSPMKGSSSSAIERSPTHPSSRRQLDSGRSRSTRRLEACGCSAIVWSTATPARPRRSPGRSPTCTTTHHRPPPPCPSVRERFIFGRRRVDELRRGRRHDVDAGLEQSFVVRHRARCRHALVRSPCRRHNRDRARSVRPRPPVVLIPSGSNARELAGITADLLRCVHPDTDQFRGRANPAIVFMVFVPTPPVAHTTTR